VRFNRSTASGASRRARYRAPLVCRQALPRALFWSRHDAPHPPPHSDPPAPTPILPSLLFVVHSAIPPHTAGRSAGPRLQRRSAANSSTPSFARLVPNVPHPLRSTSSPTQHVISPAILLARRHAPHRHPTGTHCVRTAPPVCGGDDGEMCGAPLEESPRVGVLKKAGTHIGHAPHSRPKMPARPAHPGGS
jgi:hypothetical protein